MVVDGCFYLEKLITFNNFRVISKLFLKTSLKLFKCSFSSQLLIII